MSADDCFLRNDSAADLFNLITGPEIGVGQYRKVYENLFNPKQVIKQDSGANYSNINEWQMWEEFAGTPLEQWLAPVYHISPRGMWLVMARTTPIPIGKYPKRVPSIFADMKPDNWGWYKGRPVCHDYGNHAVFTLARTSGRKLQSVVWEHNV